MRGYSDIILDFSQANRAYPNGMIAILCSADDLRRKNIGISISLPVESNLQRLFLNTNWAHFLDAGSYARSETEHERHLATHRFTDHNEQQRVVNNLMDVVMRNTTMSRDMIAGLEWSINEITDNVLNHAECEEGGLVQVSTYRDNAMVDFAVGDSGGGILASLRQGFPTLTTDAQAIGEAVKAGVTRSPDAGQGNGLAGTMRIATGSGGNFQLTSGQAQLVVYGGESKLHRRKKPQTFVGTLVTAAFGLNQKFHLAELLGFSGTPAQPVDLIELQYETDAGDALVLKLANETTGFGSRRAGLQLRTKCLNLLNAEPAKPLIIDWSGVPIVSSSFADELVGRLFVELGPIGFTARIRSIGMEATIRTLVDTAVMQRVAQTMASPRFQDDDT